MKITRFEHGLDLSKPTEGYVRSPGLHVSDLYNSFYKKFDPKRYNKDGPPDATKMSLGTSFEEVLERALAERLLGDRPGEFTSPEGIIFSPDYLFDIDGELVLGEFKCTWYSSRSAPHDPKFEKWFTQIKLYCYWLQLRKARLYVLFVNDTYRPPKPELYAWNIEFTPRELQDEYHLIMRHAREEGIIS